MILTVYYNYYDGQDDGLCESHKNYSYIDQKHCALSVVIYNYVV